MGVIILRRAKLYLRYYSEQPSQKTDNTVAMANTPCLLSAISFMTSFFAP